MNPSTLSGAIDIIVVRQKNGDLMSSPFHVRFGKLKLLNPSDKIVELTVNGNLVDINMKVGEAGEAFFVIETCNQVPSEYATSPIVLAVNAEDAPEIEPFQLGEDPLENLEIVQEDSPTSKHNIILDDENVVINVDPMLNETLKPNHEEFETDKVGIKIPGVKYEQDLAVDKKMPPNSPPWVWAWGGLPERSKEPTIETEKEHSLNRMVSSPVMGINSQVVPSGTISHEEKVGKYLAELPVYKGTKRIAIDESLDDTSIHNILNGAPVTFNNKLKLSSCGPLSEFQKLDADKAKLKFEEKIIDYQHFCDNPNLLTSPEMLFMVNGFYHSWETAAPIIMAQVLFQQPLSVPGAKKILQRKQSRWSTWWAGDKPKNTDVPPKLENTKSDLKTKASEPIMRYSIVRSESSTVGRPHSPATIEEVQYAKSLRLNSDQLKSLDLREGMNTITFSVISGFQGRSECSARIFLWNYDDNIVISDIDGTITKSDVLGHLANMVSYDWTHVGVANYYSKIAKNGYKFFYLTSRAIGQAGSTREYLDSIEQDKQQLPPGPVLLSPDRLFAALQREVIQRRPQEFKMACLRDLKRLFDGRDPFYAGFGNRITDALSYRSVNVPPSRIFTIDPTGEVKLQLLTSFSTSYVKLVETVDHLFPPVKVLDSEYSDINFWKPSLPKIDIKFDHDPIIPSAESDASEDEMDFEKRMSILHDD